MAELNLDDLARKILRLGDKAVEIVKDVVDKYASTFEHDVEAGIPRRTGGLESSLKFTEIKKSQKHDKYGYSLTLKGSPPSVGVRGESPKSYTYHDIAYYLNYHGYIREGSSDIAAIRERGFISTAESKLSGIDEEINARWREAAGGQNG